MSPDPAFDRAMRALFYARRIALVGASPNNLWATGLADALERGGYTGDVFPVNPRYTEVGGSVAYPSVDAIPGGAELAILVIPQRAILDVLGQCERAGVGAVNIITSGFAEVVGDAGAAARQRAIREWAVRTGIRVAGPNCVGNLSVPNAMNAAAGLLEQYRPGPVAAVMQSGYLAAVLQAPAYDRGIGFTYVVTSGNEADLQAADYIRFFAEDDETRIIACYIEQLRGGARFLESAELAAERGKPLVVLKAGRSEKGSRRTLAHTGALAGSDAIADAVMRRYGITRVDSLDEMVEALAVFHARTLPRGGRVGSFNLSGGAAVLMADAGEKLGITYPELESATVERLQQAIPDYGTIANPIDATGQSAVEVARIEPIFAALAEDPNIDLIVYSLPFPTVMDIGAASGIPADLTDRYPDKPVLFVTVSTGRTWDAVFGDEQMTNPATSYAGIPFLHGVDEGMKAVRALLRYAEFQRERSQTPARVETPAHIVADARALLTSAEGRPLVERVAKQLLALYDIPVTRELLATTAEAAVDAARALGYPVALKVESADVPHKTEAGGVLLGIASDDEARAGFERVVNNVARHAPRERFAGVLVQELLPPGRELLLGMRRDADFGAAVALGLGGVFAEVLADVALGLAPLTGGEIRAMLASLRGYALLDGSGARGAGPADIDALVALVERFARLCFDLRDEVAEIDINPLLVYGCGQGARVVDCLIVPLQDREG